MNITYKKRHKHQIIACLIMSLSGFVMATETLPESELAVYRAHVNELGETLKSELLKALQAGGPLTALAVCNEQAPVKTMAISEKHELEIGRTSLKVRNPQNAPDDWEMKVLKMFEERKANGENPTQLEYYEVIDNAGKKQVRYMKAIPVAPPCLTCHGAEITPDITTKLKVLYPKDQATGFKMGDLRGAFTLMKAY